MAKVYVTDASFTTLDAERRIVETAGFEFGFLQTKDPAEIIARAADADGLLVQWAPMDRTIFEALTNLKVVGRYGIGVDNINLADAKEFGITIVNCPDYCLDEVSDSALAFILAAARQVIGTTANVRAGKWSMEGVGTMYSLNGRTLGLVGFGAIGRRVAAKAQAFGLRILVSDPAVGADTVKGLGAALVDLDTLLSEADYVSLHAPATSATRHMINAATLAKMKPDAVLINTARGALVDTNALTDALRNGTIAMAMLDVLETEPAPADLPLLALPNCHVAPHVAALSPGAIETLQRSVAEDVVSVVAGRAPRWPLRF